MVQPVRLVPGSAGTMTDDDRREAQPPGGEPQPDVPWWSQPSGGAWDTPAYVGDSGQQATGTAAPGPSYTERSYTEPSYTEPSYTEPSYTEPTRTLWDTPGSPVDTLGREPRERRRPAAGLLVALATL